MDASELRISRRPDARGGPVVEAAKLARGPGVSLGGTFDFADVVTLWDRLRDVTRGATGPTFDIDLSRVDRIDGGSMALLVTLRAELSGRGIEVDIVGAEGTVKDLVHLYGGDVDARPRRKRAPESLLSHIGRATLEYADDAKQILSFVGDWLLGTLGLLREPKTGNWKEVVPLMERVGADAVPIVVLINFLVGFVMAFQGAVQLKQFGANIFVADLVGVSVARELGPLMTAIILCGRSGAAFAAELGTMKVSEEVDALRTLGFGPMRYLVLPRSLALMLVMPPLTLLADAVAMTGGLLVGVGSLDLTAQAYLNETQRAVSLWSVGQGLVKSVVFSQTIALIACQQGFATSGGAEGVGRRTTSSVVTILFALILVDAAFTLFFYSFHL